MLPTDLIHSLVQVLGPEGVRTGPQDLDSYSVDALAPHRAFSATHLLDRMADAVVIPRSVDQVVEVVKLASKHRVPIVPYGGGTGVMGAATPIKGGIVVDMKGLDRIVDINPADLTATVEAGVVLEDLGRALRDQGLVLGHDPWSVPIATVAGAISTNGVGYLGASHGPMGDQVMGLEVVLPTGDVLTTRAIPKYSAGPNLNHLFIGSEGVFGIITRATLRVSREPEKRAFATVAFPDFNRGFEAVAELFALGLAPSLVDLTEEDGSGIRLYMMYEGYSEGVEAAERRSLEVCRAFGGDDIGPSETMDYWHTRHQIGESYKRDMLGQPRRVRWGRRGRSFDYLHVALPLSNVLPFRRECDDILARRSARAVEYAIWTRPELFSLLLVPDTADGTEPDLHTLGETVDQILTLAQDMGGTMEYCHGVGIKLAHLLSREMGLGFNVARAIKTSLDPNNIMNPGKLY